MTPWSRQEEHGLCTGLCRSLEGLGGAVIVGVEHDLRGRRARVPHHKSIGFNICKLIVLKSFLNVCLAAPALLPGIPLGLQLLVTSVPICFSSLLLCLALNDDATSLNGFLLLLLSGHVLRSGSSMLVVLLTFAVVLVV